VRQAAQVSSGLGHTCVCLAAAIMLGRAPALGLNACTGLLACCGWLWPVAASDLVVLLCRRCTLAHGRGQCWAADVCLAAGRQQVGDDGDQHCCLRSIDGACSDKKQGWWCVLLVFVLADAAMSADGGCCCVAVVPPGCCCWWWWQALQMFVDVLVYSAMVLQHVLGAVLPRRGFVQ